MRLPFLGRRRPVVPVIRLSGVISSGSRLRGGLNLPMLAAPIERAFRVKGAAAIALDINSPGGSPVQSALLFKRIRDLAAEKGLPVFAFAQDVAASGGYWLACAGDEIYAEDNSIIGSIGVISSSFGLQDLIARIGVERRVHTSGERKSFLDPFVTEKPEDVDRLHALQAEMHESFRNLVRNRRNGKLKEDEDVLFSGEFWTGRRALDLGLVDGLGDLRSVLRARYGSKVRFRVFGVESRWLRRRLGLGFRGETIDASGLVDDLFGALEARAIWARYGL